MTQESLSMLRGLVYEKFGNQVSFAKEIEWHPNKVSALLSGKYVPDVNEAARVFVTLKMSKQQFEQIFLPKQSPNGDEPIQ